MNKELLEKFTSIDSKLSDYVGMSQQRLCKLKKDAPKFYDGLYDGWANKIRQSEKEITQIIIKEPNRDKLILTLSNGFSIEMYEVMCLSAAPVEEFLATDGMKKRYEISKKFEEFIK